MTNVRDQWNHILLEAFCSRKWSDKKDKYLYEVVFNKKNHMTGEFKKIPNKDYDLNYKTPRKPSFCPGGTPEYVCLEKDCPFLAYCNADKSDYNIFYKVLFKKYQTEEKHIKNKYKRIK